MQSLPEKIDEIETAWELHLKGYKDSEIASHLGITRVQAKNLVSDAKLIVESRVNEDPDFMSRIQENTVKTLDELDLITKEAWDTYNYTKQQEMANQQVNALKLIQGLAETKARLVSLLGANVDGTNLIQMRKLEKVNEIVSSVIKEVVADCDHCRVEAQIRLAEAFRLMEREAEIIIPEAPIALPTVDDDDTSDALADVIRTEE